MLRYKKQTNAKGGGQYAPFFIRAPKPKRKNSRIYSPFLIAMGVSIRRNVMQNTAAFCLLAWGVSLVRNIHWFILKSGNV